MALPPSEAGKLQLTLARRRPTVADTPVGAEGGVGTGGPPAPVGVLTIPLQPPSSRRARSRAARALRICIAVPTPGEDTALSRSVPAPFPRNERRRLKTCKH